MAARNYRRAICISWAAILSLVIFFVLNFRGQTTNIISSLFTPQSNHGPLDLSLLHPNEHVNRAAKSLSFHWDVTKDYRSPDGVRKLVYLINGEFPGPTIEARSGDTIVVEVKNILQDEGVAFHWHGMHMKGANNMDGAVGITQNPIVPGETFTYKFQIERSQAGTFWYHSHSGLQRADGLFGGFVVHAPLSEAVKYEYDDEKLLLIGDWYHRPAEEVQASYVTHDSWGREPVPDSLLINGKGAFNCSMAVESRPLECVDLSPPELVQSSRRTRIRVVNVGAMSGITVAMSSSQITVIQVDGGNEIVPSPSSSSVGVLYTGERIDMIVEKDPGTIDSHPCLSITLDAENYAIQNKALTLTHNFRITDGRQLSVKRGHSFRPPQPHTEGGYNLTSTRGPYLSFDSMPVLVARNIVVYTKMEILAHLGNVPVGYMNRTAWAPQRAPTKPLIELDRSQWDANQLIPWIPYSKYAGQGKGRWVDIVVNNLDEKGHPFHLHGHDFYVLQSYRPESRGYHAYNPFEASDATAAKLYNLLNPIKKDTVYVPSQGYVVLRILADNIGIWFFHCHVIWHSNAGMAMALQVGVD